MENRDKGNLYSFFKIQICDGLNLPFAITYIEYTEWYQVLLVR